MAGHIVFGIVAHVDAGKTTLSEALLYKTGAIRRAGRVDKGDTVLDNNAIERDRGITVFSKQAEMTVDNLGITLLDTPGHVDFSAEMERVLSVLDFAVLVVSAPAGIQSHTLTLWRLLKRYNKPVFIFVNKLDQAGADRDKAFSELKTGLTERIVDFSDTRINSPEFYEDIALADEKIMENYLSDGTINDADIKRLIGGRKVFPCFFGSALRMDGVDEFLRGIINYAPDNKLLGEINLQNNKDSNNLSARVFKISRDSDGTRLSHIRIFNGEIRVKDIINGEKINQIRVYSGGKYETRDSASNGEVCALTGLTETYAGEGIGLLAEKENLPLIAPVVSYSVILPKETDATAFLPKLREMAEEIPEINVNPGKNNDIEISLMGAVQLEIIKKLISDRYGINISFTVGKILYKETIDTVTEGVGHLEPLRHYAEVHLVLEPGERGSGITVNSIANSDSLAANWQNLIISDIEQTEIKGVLTGAPVTDIVITLVSGKDNIKHTSPGDFREATLRAVRNGLMRAHSVLLWPVYDMRLEIPTENTGRAMTDLTNMKAAFTAPETVGENTVISGRVPAALISDYALTVRAYTKGKGNLSLSLSGYEPCPEPEEIIEEANYYPESDLANTADSVFCSHGAGFIVPWSDVPDYMHLPSVLYGHDAFYKPRDSKYPIYDILQGGEISENNESEDDSLQFMRHAVREDRQTGSGSDEIFLGVEEVDALVAGAGSANRRRAADDRRSHWNRYNNSVRNNLSSNSNRGNTGSANKVRKLDLNKEDFLLVDGYNIIFAWPELRELMNINIDSARDKLTEILANYQGYTKVNLILVFDAYKVHGGVESVSGKNGFTIVYTKEAETADQYIAKTSAKLSDKGRVSVASSDSLVQLIIYGAGAVRLSAMDLLSEVNRVNVNIREKLP